MSEAIPDKPHCEFPGGLIIDGFSAWYRQILTNLFLNATNHAFPNGRSGTISIEASLRANDDIEIIFSDNGIGMTPDRSSGRRSDPFFTTRRKEYSPGLGLQHPL